MPYIPLRQQYYNNYDVQNIMYEYYGGILLFIIIRRRIYARGMTVEKAHKNVKQYNIHKSYLLVVCPINCWRRFRAMFNYTSQIHRATFVDVHFRATEEGRNGL